MNAYYKCTGTFVLKQTENRALVSKTFVKAVIQSKEMTRVQCEQLLLFLMDNRTQLFKVCPFYKYIVLENSVQITEC